MILVDANVWVDHLRMADHHLEDLIGNRSVLVHPYTIGEVGLGSLARRSEVVENLELFPQAPVASHEEVMALIALNSLAGTGIGYVDCHLLSSALLIGGRLWTRDRRLDTQANRLGISHDPQSQ